MIGFENLSRSLIAAVAFVFVASCGPPTAGSTSEGVAGQTSFSTPDGDWVQASQLLATSAVPTQERYDLLLTRDPAPEGTTLSLWKFQLRAPNGDFAVFQESHPVGPALDAIVRQPSGEVQSIVDVMAPHRIEEEGTISALYDVVSVGSDEMPALCPGARATHIVFQYSALVEDPHLTLHTFEGLPNAQTAVALCRTLALRIDQTRQASPQ